jgi:ribosomal protein S1
MSPETFAPEKALTAMAGLAEKIVEPPKEGSIVEGTVLALDRARLYIDLPPFGTGVIFGREYMNAREVIKRVNIGDVVAAKVISTDSKEGYIELSLKEARQAII